jgi:hypothetical protein
MIVTAVSQEQTTRGPRLVPHRLMKTGEEPGGAIKEEGGAT